MRFAATRNGIAALILATGALAACASDPDALQPMRQRLALAAGDGEIRTHATAALAEAQRTLALAEDADEPPVRDHFVYLTGKNLEIAEAIVVRRRAELELAALRKDSGQAAARKEEPERKAERNGITATPLPQPQPKPARNVALTIPDLAFGSGKAALTAGAKRRLDPLVASLRNDPALSALVEGYTDDSGGHEANLRISLSRAKAVKAYLVEQGIAPGRIQTLGHGEQYPIASNATAEGRSQNRRIEIVVHRTESMPRQDARRR